MVSRSQLARISRRLIGTPGELSLRHRIFNVILLIGMVMTLSATIMNHVLGLGLLTVLAPAACGVVTVGAYYYSIVRHRFRGPALVIVAMLTVAFFPTMWVINGGTYGSIPYYFIINAAIIAVLLTGKTRLCFLTLFVLITGALIIAEYHSPEIFIFYDEELTRYQDLSFGFLITLLSNALLFGVVVDSFIRERAQVNRLLNELRHKSEKIARQNAVLFRERNELKRLSDTDALTGTFNRRFVTAFLEDIIPTLNEQVRPATVALLDIDRFKEVNDRYGHIFGDHVLRTVAESISSHVRHDDVVGRFGGDEFLIILPNSDIDEGHAILERIRREIERLSWENDASITISGGITSVSSDARSNPLEAADELLYRAKRSRRNRIERSGAKH